MKTITERIFARTPVVKLLTSRRAIDSLLVAKSRAGAISILKKHEALIRLHSELGG